MNSVDWSNGDSMDVNPAFGADVATAAWRPGGRDLRDSRLAGLLRQSGERDLSNLQRHAERDPAWFWGLAADDLALPWQRRPSKTLDVSNGIEWARWWSGGRFNYAAASTDARATSAPDSIALRWEGEDGETRILTNATLKRDVGRVAHMLSEDGVGPGDRVGVLLPMIPEATIAILALGRLGAIYLPMFSGYAAPAVAERLRDAGATALITSDGFLRRGRIVPLKETADDAVAAAPSVKRVFVVRRMGDRVSVTLDPTRDRWWDEALDAIALDRAHVAPETDPETPYLILYTSGTTARPKGTLHVHGGFPIKGAQDLAHDFDLGPGDTLFWFTDLGWMMGPWAISGALLLGATLLLYEGAPDYPGPDRIWELVQRHRVTHLGLSPTLVRSLMAHGLEPVASHDISSLRILGSAGEPCNPTPWWWLFRDVGRCGLPIINYSGGTEVSGGILSNNLLCPIKPCAFAGPSIGTAADVVSPGGQSLRQGVGELALRAPLPGMTRGFWRDRERYLETYWRQVPGIWIHGDWAEVDIDGHWHIHGRSDDTLKIAGKRVGPAEVESAATGHPALLEAAAIGVPHEIKGEVIVVFCRLRPGLRESDALRAEIRARIIAALGNALAPNEIVIVKELPKTRSGKVMRRLVRAAWLGLELDDSSSLENPHALEDIRLLGRAV